MGALAQSVNEPAAGAAAARMFPKRRQRLDQSVTESRYVERRDGLELPEPDVTSNYWSEAPIIRPA